MTAADPIIAVQAVQGATAQATQATGAAAAPSQSFGDMLAHAVADAERKVRAADDLVAAFAVDDSVPVHQVTIALQEARIAVDLAMQVRSRLVEGYREIMNMQL